MTILKVCTVHGELDETKVIKSGKSKMGLQFYKCKECMKFFHRNHYERNKEKVLLKIKERRDADPIKHKEMKRRSYLKHFDANREKNNRRSRYYKETNGESERLRAQLKKRREIDTLAVRYVKEILVKRTGFKRADIPIEMVDIKRIILRLKRLAKDEREGNKNGKS